MRQFKSILMALTLALAIGVVAGAAGTQTPVSKCQDFACQS